MDQTIINWVLAVLSGAIGFLVKSLWDAVKDLQHADKELTDKVANIEILVAGSYVKQDALDKLSDAIFKKLDRIEDKLDGKVDKI